MTQRTLDKVVIEVKSVAIASKFYSGKGVKNQF